MAIATTRLMPLHIGKGRDVSTAVADIIDYVENPQKTDNGKFISGYACDTRTADAEFLLAKQQYRHITGRSRGADDVIAYHVRQSFKPGEITPEDANRIGRGLAMTLTKGGNAFVVCTHVDKHHVHNHIIINSTNLDCARKFRNFWDSTWAVRRINDKLCLENGLSIVDEPKPSRGHYGKWLGEENKKLPFQEQLRMAIDAALVQRPTDFDDFLRRLEAENVTVLHSGKHLRLLAPGQKKPTRCDTLKGDYTEQAIRERISGRRIVSPRPRALQPQPKVGLLIDIEAAVQKGKGLAYERWAKVYNIKQLSQAVAYLKAHGDMSYEELAEKVLSLTDDFNALSDQIKTLESQMNANGELQKQIVSYAKTRAVYTAYRKAGYSKKYRAEHEADILIHQAAKKHFDAIGITKLPSVKVLREEYAGLLAEKRKAYAGYKQARADMRELHNVKANVEYLLGIAPEKETARVKTKSRQ